jgi:universal stress protein A
MTDVKRILVPLDFSASSRAAFRQAVMLAARFEAHIDVLHVWEPSPVVAPDQMQWLGGDADSFWRNLSDDLKKRLDEVVAEEAPAGDTSIDVSVEAGYVAHTILKRIEKGAYDLVVMGTHGRRGLSHVLVGSVAERVVRLSSVPVLTVHTPRPAKEKAKAHTPSPAAPRG